MPLNVGLTNGANSLGYTPRGSTRYGQNSQFSKKFKLPRWTLCMYRRGSIPPWGTAFGLHSHFEAPTPRPPPPSPSPLPLPPPGNRATGPTPSRVRTSFLCRKLGNTLRQLFAIHDFRRFRTSFAQIAILCHFGTPTPPNVQENRKNGQFGVKNVEFPRNHWGVVGREICNKYAPQLGLTNGENGLG
jgi:hypothetical protein